MKFQVYRDRSNQYRWRMVAANGRTVADSGEGYIAKTDCLAAIDLIKRYANSAPVDDTTASAGFGRW